MDFFSGSATTAHAVMQLNAEDGGKRKFMTILAHNIYRLFAMNFPGFSRCEAQTIFDKFITVQGEVVIESPEILIKLKKKRTLPLILEQLSHFEDTSYSWLNGMRIKFIADTTT